MCKRFLLSICVKIGRLLSVVFNRFESNRYFYIVLYICTRTTFFIILIKNEKQTKKHEQPSFSEKN